MKRILLCILVLSLYEAGAQKRYDVLIDEIMADPGPTVGLPNNEWIELRNIGSQSLSLKNWRLADVSGQSGPMPDFILEPDSFVVVCGSSSVPALIQYGNVIGISSFPSLDNDGETIWLISPDGRVIHSLTYSGAWFKNELKRQGGWTLEMIDITCYCIGAENWIATVDVRGGSPASINSVDGLTPDDSPPLIKKAFVESANSIILEFGEPLDSLTASDIQHYSIDNGSIINEASLIEPGFYQVRLGLANELEQNTVYTITINGIEDCKGNIIEPNSAVWTGLPVDVQPGSICINEILFNPRPGGYDYVEIYNKGTGIIDASGIFVANRNGGGMISSIREVTTEPFYVFPGEYIVMTENPESLEREYHVRDPSRVLLVSSIPSFPDDAGTVILLNSQGDLVDEVGYFDDWHFSLIANDEGVSLERIDPGDESGNRGNWHSAASTAGYGTPGYVNSQFRALASPGAVIEVLPRVFSPNNDGRDDIVSIQYKMEELGNVANIIIYDIAGREVRHLVNNGTLSLAGHWNWDGLGDMHKKLPIGIYVVNAEVFNLEGKRRRFRAVMVLIR